MLQKLPLHLNNLMSLLVRKNLIWTHGVGVYAWRDRLARQEDESTNYVLPNHMLFRIAASMPTDVASLLACCSPVPPLVRLYASDLVVLIQPLKERTIIMHTDLDEGTVVEEYAHECCAYH